MNDLEKEIALAEQLADISGEILGQYFRQPNLETQTKVGQISAIATSADREAEEAMVELILDSAPEDGIIREEGENISSKNGRYWVLDPIDGTSSFVKGMPIFGTLIGLVKQDSNQVLLGLVNQPILQECWLGILGQTTLFNGQLIINSYAEDSSYQLEQVCLASTTPLMFITEKQQAVAKRCQQVCKRTAFGGDCYNYVSLASGWSSMPIVVLESDLHYYDFCALIPIVKGTGGAITDWSGNPLNSQSTEVIAASNPWLLEQALNLISDLVN